jgi:phosphonate utilization transcriptional regulator
MKSAETKPIAFLQQHSLPDLVQMEIERMILSGELTAGSKLNEVMFAELLGVSRGPVREAFRALEGSGLVQQEKNQGVFVRQVSVEEADEIYEVRASLDELAGRKLAQQITQEQLNELRDMLKHMDQYVEQKDVDAYHKLNLEFHDTLVQMAGNKKLLDTYRRLVNELNLYRRTALGQKGTLPISTREHHEIVDTIASRDAEAAGAVMRKHVMESRNRMHKARAASTPD